MTTTAVTGRAGWRVRALQAVRFAGIVAIVGLGFASPARAQGVPIVFDLPAGVDPSRVFIQFLNTLVTMTGTYRGADGAQHSLAINTAYSLASITSPVSVGGGAPANKPAVYITDFRSGRAYISFGATGLKGLGGNYQPDPANSADPN